MLRGGWLQQPLQPGTNIVICRHKNTKVQTLPKIALRQHQNTVHNDDRLGLDSARLSAPQVGAEVINRNIHGGGAAKLLKVFDQERGLQRIGVIIVDLPALLKCEIWVRTVIVSFTLETTLDSVKSALSLVEIRPVPEITQNQFALFELDLLGICRCLCFERRLFEKVIPDPDSKDLAGL